MTEVNSVLDENFKAFKDVLASFLKSFVPVSVDDENNDTSGTTTTESTGLIEDCYELYLEYKELFADAGITYDIKSQMDLDVIKLMLKYYADEELKSNYDKIIELRGQYKGFATDEYKASIGVPVETIPMDLGETSSLVLRNMVAELKSNISFEWISDPVNYDAKVSDINFYSSEMFSVDTESLLTDLEKMKEESKFEDAKKSYDTVLDSYLQEGKPADKDVFNPELTPKFVDRPEDVREFVSQNKFDKYSAGLVKFVTDDISKSATSDLVKNQLAELLTIIGKYQNCLSPELYDMFTSKYPTMSAILNKSVVTPDDSSEYNELNLEIKDAIKKFIVKYKPADNKSIQEDLDKTLIQKTKEWQEQMTGIYNEHKEAVDIINSYVFQHSNEILVAWINTVIILMSFDGGFDQIKPVEGNNNVLNAMVWLGMIRDPKIVRSDLITKQSCVAARLKIGVSYQGRTDNIFGKFLKMDPFIVTAIVQEAQNVTKGTAPFIIGGQSFATIEQVKSDLSSMMFASFLLYEEAEEADFVAEPEVDPTLGRKGFAFFESTLPVTIPAVQVWEEWDNYFNYLYTQEGKAKFGAIPGSEEQSVAWVAECDKALTEKIKSYDNIFKLANHSEIVYALLMKHGQIRVINGINDGTNAPKDYSKSGVQWIVTDTSYWQSVTEFNKYASEAWVHCEVSDITLTDIKYQKHIKSYLSMQDGTKYPAKGNHKNHFALGSFKNLKEKYPKDPNWAQSAKEGMMESHWNMSLTMADNVKLIKPINIITYPLFPFVLKSDCKEVGQDLELGVLGKALVTAFNRAAQVKCRHLRWGIDSVCAMLQNRDINGKPIAVTKEQKESILSEGSLNSMKLTLSMLDSLEQVDESPFVVKLINQWYNKQNGQKLYDKEDCVIELREVTCYVSEGEKNGQGPIYPPDVEVFLTKSQFDMNEHWKKWKGEYQNNYANWTPSVDWTTIQIPKVSEVTKPPLINIRFSN